MVWFKTIRQPMKTKLAEKVDAREKTHLEIAMSAAVAAGLAASEAEARRNMEQILERNAAELKPHWLRQERAGIKGWINFLRTFGFRERLTVERIEDVGVILLAKSRSRG